MRTFCLALFELLLHGRYGDHENSNCPEIDSGIKFARTREKSWVSYQTLLNVSSAAESE
jgi:hypothetical protein